jgi:hypothetical protein
MTSGTPKSRTICSCFDLSGREKGRKEGRKEGRKGGRKRERKEGKTGIALSQAGMSAAGVRRAGTGQKGHWELRETSPFLTHFSLGTWLSQLSKPQAAGSWQSQLPCSSVQFQLYGNLIFFFFF